MFIFRFIFNTIFSIASALIGNRVGEQLRAQYTDRDVHQLRLIHTNEQGETIIAANPLMTNLLPALLFGFVGRPRWLYTFAGGILASALLGDRYEGQFMEYWRGQRTIVISSTVKETNYGK